MASTVHFDQAAAAAQITRTIHYYINDGWLPGDGTPLTMSYGFRGDPPSGSSFWNEYPAGVRGFQRFSSAEITAARTVLNLWSDAANITFVTAPTFDGKYVHEDIADLVFANFTSGPNYNLGYWSFSYPGPQRDSMVWLNGNFAGNQSPTLLNGGYSNLLHEIGHALGLDHPGSYDAGNGVPVTYENSAEYIEDTVQYSVMSYFSEVHTGANFAGLPFMTPMLHDISAVQLLYGANMSTRTGNTIYGFNSNAGNISDPLNPYVLNNATDQRVFCVWDAGGSDTFDFSGYATTSTIDLREGAFSSVGGLVKNVSIAFGAIIENAIGGSGSDTLTGNDVANILYGGRGNDTLSGKLGNDTFVYDGNGADSVVDFSKQVGDSDSIRIVDAYRSFSELEPNISVVGGSTWISFGAGKSLTLNGFVGPLSEADFEFVPRPQPEISVSGNGANIADGDLLPDTIDGTSFGTVGIGSVVTHTFSVTNEGDLALAIAKLKIPKGFVLTEGLSTSLSPGVSDTFTLSMDTAKVGARTGQITFTTNDADEVAYNFALSGNVIVIPPEIEVLGNGTVIADNDLSADASDGTAFGDVALGSIAAHTFTVSNTGAGTLSISKLKMPKGFVLAEGLAATIAPNQSDTFQVRVDTTKIGLKTGQITFTTNDPDETPFNFALSANVTAASQSISAAEDGGWGDEGSAFIFDQSAEALQFDDLHNDLARRIAHDFDIV